MKNWNHVCQNVPVDTATYWASQVLDFCDGRLEDSGAIFVKQDNIKKEIVLKDMKDVKVEVGEDFGIKVEIKEEMVVKEEVEDPDHNSLNNLRSLDSLCLDFVKKEPESKVKKEPRSVKKASTDLRKVAIEKKPLIGEHPAAKKEDKLTNKVELKKEVKTALKEEVKKEDKVVIKEESILNVQPGDGKKLYRGSRSAGNLKNPPTPKYEAAGKKSKEFEGVFEQAAKKTSQARKRTSLWEASGELEMPSSDAVLATQLQLEERRRSERLLERTATATSTVTGAKKMG